MPVLTRKKYLRPKEIAEIYSISPRLVYKYMQMPVFKEARKQVGDKSVRIDLEKFDEIINQYFNSR